MWRRFTQMQQNSILNNFYKHNELNLPSIIYYKRSFLTQNHHPQIKHILSCVVWLWLLPLGVFIYLEWEKVLPEQAHNCFGWPSAKTWGLSSNPSESPCMYRAEIQIFLVLSNNNNNNNNDKMLVLYRVEVMWCTRSRRILGSQVLCCSEPIGLQCFRVLITFLLRD